MEEKYLYIIFSSVPTKIGKFIRFVTRHPYNHISISLDAELNTMFSFARRYYRTPLYGGFVRESVSRYHIKGNPAQMQICQIPITQSQYRMLSKELYSMLDNSEQYLYNHLSVLTSLLRKSVRLKDAYMCVEFVAEVLSRVGIDIAPNAYHSVADLEKILRKYITYTGPAPNTEIYDTRYYSQKPLPHPWIATATAFIKLFHRFN